MRFACSHCNQPLDIDEDITSKTVQCPACGRFIPNPIVQKPAATVTAQQIVHEYRINKELAASDETGVQHVVITDIKMSIPAMMIFMLKWIVASIPVFIIVGVVYFLGFALFVGGCAAMMLGGKFK